LTGASSGHTRFSPIALERKDFICFPLVLMYLMGIVCNDPRGLTTVTGAEILRIFVEFIIPFWIADNVSHLPDLRAEGCDRL
jgi:hypothetical protein